MNKGLIPSGKPYPVLPLWLGGGDPTYDGMMFVMDSTAEGGIRLVAPPFMPLDLGFIAWTEDPKDVRDSSALTNAGTLWLTLIKRVPPGVITNIEMDLIAAGATLTSGQCFAGLYSAANKTLLASTADQSVPWVSPGLKSMALTAPIQWTGGDLYVGVFYNGTTGPSFLRGLGSGAFTANGKLSVANSRFASANTGLTTAMPATLGTFTGTSTFTHWAALS